jgi:hypothetical protein
MAGLGDTAKEYIAGSAAGVAQVVVGHPFDTVKVILFPPFLASLFIQLLVIGVHHLRVFDLLCFTALAVFCMTVCYASPAALLFGQMLAWFHSVPAR